METDDVFVQRARREARKQVPLEPFKDGDTLSFGCRDYRRVSPDFSVQVRYEVMRIRGESHNMAETLALRTFPATRTDREFNLGRCNGNQFEGKPGLGDHYRHLAEQAGVSTTGKYYQHGLASFPGDPTAWVSDKADVLRVAKEKGFKVSGQVEYDPGEREPEPDVVIADDLVEAMTDDIMDMDGGYRREDVREKSYNRLAGLDGAGSELLVSEPTADF